MTSLAAAVNKFLAGFIRKPDVSEKNKGGAQAH